RSPCTQNRRPACNCPLSPALSCNPAVHVDEAVLPQPAARVLGVTLEPRARTPQSKTVSPLVHVAKQTLAPDTGQLIGQQDLQVTHARLLGIVPAGVTL